MKGFLNKRDLKDLYIFKLKKMPQLAAIDHFTVLSGKRQVSGSPAQFWGVPLDTALGRHCSNFAQ